MCRPIVEGHERHPAASFIACRAGGGRRHASLHLPRLRDELLVIAVSLIGSCIVAVVVTVLVMRLMCLLQERWLSRKTLARRHRIDTVMKPGK
jgi:hypothetical protein